MKTDQQPRGRRGLIVVFCVSLGLSIADWLILESSQKPCNPNDFTGCSPLGEAAVFGFLFLIPITIGLALILALTYARDLLRRR
jgi:hypothetical protein